MVVDWRDRLAEAIAYRMHYRHPLTTTVEDAKNSIRDFTMYGPNSAQSAEVMSATFELFSADVQMMMPVIRAAIAQISKTVEREILIGREIAARLEPTDG